MQDQFVGYMSGENIGYANTVNYGKDLHPLLANMAPGVAGRGQILDRVRELYTAGLEQKFTTAYAVPAANVPFGPNPVDAARLGAEHRYVSSRACARGMGRAHAGA